MPIYGISSRSQAMLHWLEVDKWIAIIRLCHSENQVQQKRLCSGADDSMLASRDVVRAFKCIALGTGRAVWSLHRAQSVTQKSSNTRGKDTFEFCSSRVVGVRVSNTALQFFCVSCITQKIPLCHLHLSSASFLMASNV